MPQARLLNWNDAKGDVNEDRVLEALEDPENPGLGTWQITLHDGGLGDGPKFDWYLYDADGDVPIDIGFGETVEACKAEIEKRREGVLPARALPVWSRIDRIRRALFG